MSKTIYTADKYDRMARPDMAKTWRVTYDGREYDFVTRDAAIQQLDALDKVHAAYAGIPRERPRLSRI